MSAVSYTLCKYTNFYYFYQAYCRGFFLIWHIICHEENIFFIFDVLKRFVITDELYEDGLTKHNLIKAIKKVFKGKLQCLWKLDYNFNVNKKSNQDNMFV